MNADLRASLLVGAVAGGLSMLVGLIARVSFLPLVLRGLVFGAIFGGLAWGVISLLRSSVPDLFEPSGAREGEGSLPRAEDENAGEELGGAVDIVLDDDEGPSVLASGALGGEQAAPFLDEGGIVDVEPSGDFVEADRSDQRFAETARAASPIQSEAIPSRSPSGLDELDILPDLDAFSGSFGALDLPSGASEEGYAPSSETKGGGSVSGASPMVGPGGSDPATLAMAVRTLLKRDQKG